MSPFRRTGASVQALFRGQETIGKGGWGNRGGAARRDRARALATISRALSSGWIPRNVRLSSMIEAIERFCRAAASFSARCVRSAKLIVRRTMANTPIDHSGNQCRHHSTNTPNLQRRSFSKAASGDISQGQPLYLGKVVYLEEETSSWSGRSHFIGQRTHEKHPSFAVQKISRGILCAEVL